MTILIMFCYVYSETIKIFLLLIRLEILMIITARYQNEIIKQKLWLFFFQVLYNP